MNLEKKIKAAAFTQGFVFYVLISLSIFLPILMFTIGDSNPEEIGMIISVLIVTGVYYLIKRKKLKSGSYWIKKINEIPQDIVWLKPISVRHKLGYIITVAETPRFELWDNKKNSLTFDVSIAKRGEAMKQLKQRFPHAHYGYSKKVNKIFKKHSESFIAELQKNDLYFPLSQYES